jgi:hypothetical protein
VTRADRRRSRQWHFSDSGNRFDSRKRPASLIDPNPISKTFTRKIIHCKRCGSRVVSNVSHCPFCGKNLLPLYQRLWFWLIAVALIAAAVVALLFFFTPDVAEDETRSESPAPVAVGTQDANVIKDLATGTPVDCNGLLVTVVACSQESTSSDGTPLTSVTVQFLNRSSAVATLYSTQWQLETAEGVRSDCFIGKTSEGENVRSTLDTLSLNGGDSFTATLYFAAANPAKVVFAPNALSFDESGLVTWKLVFAQPTDEGNTEGA